MSKIMLNIFDSVTSQLTTWAGYAPLQEAMKNHLDVEFFLAGGAVRDIILGRKNPPKDFDFFLEGSNYPAILKQLKMYGRMVKGPFGSPRWYPEHVGNDYADIIPITNFYNGLWHCRDIKDVLNQFDFTGNAIAINLRDGTVHDPQNGMRDLSSGIMKLVRFDYPEEPILPDHPLSRTTVIWFRTLHYAAKLGLTIEPVTLHWLCGHLNCHSDLELFTHHIFEPCPGYMEPLLKNNGSLLQC